MGRKSGSRLDLRASPYRQFEYPLSTAGPRFGSWTPGPDTFRVEEIASYPFCGEGEHAALLVEKACRTTRDVAQGVAGRLGVHVASVGYAGMKDKASVSVQAFTVARVHEDKARQAFEEEGCRVLCATRHRNKLRLGHLAGNRFHAFLRGADPGRAAEVLAELARAGAPNYFGPQRFGARGDNPVRGLAVLTGRLRVNRWSRDLLVSSLQSFVFNETLAQRVEQTALCVARQGDVLRREDSGGLFVCTDPLADTARIAEFEISPTGPLPGRRMVRPSGEVALAEEAILADLGLGRDLFAREVGSRRPLRVRVRDWDLESTPCGVWIRFFCPAGAFATSVIREICDLGHFSSGLWQK